MIDTMREPIRELSEIELHQVGGGIPISIATHMVAAMPMDAMYSVYCGCYVYVPQ